MVTDGGMKSAGNKSNISCPAVNQSQSMHRYYDNFVSMSEMFQIYVFILLTNVSLAMLVIPLEHTN